MYLRRVLLLEVEFFLIVENSDLSATTNKRFFFKFIVST